MNRVELPTRASSSPRATRGGSQILGAKHGPCSTPRVVPPVAPLSRPLDVDDGRLDHEELACRFSTCGPVIEVGHGRPSRTELGADPPFDLREMRRLPRPTPPRGLGRSTGTTCSPSPVRCITTTRSDERDRFGHRMGDEEDCLLVGLPHVESPVTLLFACQLVQRRERLVHEEDRRVERRRPSLSRPSAASPRRAARDGVRAPPEPERLEDVDGIRCLGARPRRPSGSPGREANVVENASPRKQRRRLGTNPMCFARTALQAVRRRSTRFRCLADQACHDPKQRRLPAPGGPMIVTNSPRCDVEIDVLQRYGVPRAIVEGKDFETPAMSTDDQVRQAALSALLRHLCHGRWSRGCDALGAERPTEGPARSPRAGHTGQLARPRGSASRSRPLSRTAVARTPGTRGELCGEPITLGSSKNGILGLELALTHAARSTRCRSQPRIQDCRAGGRRAPSGR